MIPLPPSRVLHEWDAINLALKTENDPGRSWVDVLGQAISGALRFWRVAGGYVCTQVTKQGARRTFWIIYAGGKHGYLKDWRALMDQIELLALKERCSEVRFEGRDWRKVFPDYAAHRTDDGRWHFRKAL